MTEPRVESFAEFWPHYVGAHKRPLTRALHYAGTSCALACIGAGVLTGGPRWLLVAPVVGYAPAWLGHWLVERNRPATFRHPGYSLMADIKMLAYALRGKMAGEVTRLFGSPNPAPDAPPLATR